MLTFLTTATLVLVVVLVAGGGLFVWHQTRDAAAAADHWFELLRQGRFEDAHALTTLAFQNATSAQALHQGAERAGLTRTVPSSWTDREFSISAATLAGGIPTAEVPSPVAVKLLPDGPGWRVHSVVVSPLVGRQMWRFSRIRADEPGLQVATGSSQTTVPN